MGALQLTLSLGPSDKVAAIFDGRVSVEGCSLSLFPLGPEEAFQRAFLNEDFDITELSASSAIVAVARGQNKYIALPIFLSRAFRHSAFYIRTDRNIRVPQDLRGKIVGVPEYQMTAALWARGVLSDEFGVLPQDIRWRNGGLNVPGRGERVPIKLPDSIELQAVPATHTLSDMLEQGELDAIISARPPNCFVKRCANVGLLFPNYRSHEEAYFRKTGIFPIMHILAVRRSLIEQHRWLANSVIKAFHEAKRLAYASMEEMAVLPTMLPWLQDDVERVRAVMGDDYWSYGFEKNKSSIEAMFRYSVEQGLSERQLTANEFFATGTLSSIHGKD